MAKVSYERVGAAAVLTIERPERRNAVDPETADELLDGYRTFEADDDARVLVLTGIRRRGLLRRRRPEVDVRGGRGS